MISRRLRAALSAVAFAAAAVSVLVTTPAHAAAPASEPVGACVIVLPDTEHQTCFATLDQAIDYGSGGRGLFPSKGSAGSAARASAGADARVAGAAALVFNPVIIELSYPEPFFLGVPTVWVGPWGPCTTSTANIDYQAASLSAGLNNRISSFMTFANCWDDEWDLANFPAGTYHTGYRGTQAVLNATIDNDTSAIRWS
jgi:hypothetical protein